MNKFTIAKAMVFRTMPICRVLNIRVTNNSTEKKRNKKHKANQAVQKYCTNRVLQIEIVI